MSDTNKNKTRFRKNLKQFLSLKELGKLNGRAMDIKTTLKNAATEIGLNFGEELKSIKEDSKPDESSQKSNFNVDKSGNISAKDAKIGVKKTCSCDARDNPVNVPFTVTLKEIYDMHNLRSWRRLNSMLGASAPCYARNPWESTTSHLSVIYIADYHKHIYNLYLMIDGHMEDNVCKKDVKNGFKKCLKELVEKWGDLEIRIYDQGHAKKVLGAKRYKKQEKESAKKQKSGKKRQKSKKKTKPKKKKSGKKSKNKKKPKSSKKSKAGESNGKKEKQRTQSRKKKKFDKISSEKAKSDEDKVDLDAVMATQKKIDNLLESFA